MSQPVFVPPKWRKPAPLGYAKAIDSMATVASPLLAGFSLASVVVVSGDPDKFQWPGAVVIALTVGAIALIGSVQCAFNARQYLWSGADVLDWWPEIKDDRDLEAQLREEQAAAFRRWQGWSWCTRISYNIGILAFLAGLAFSLVPRQVSETQGGLRLAAAAIAFAACGGEIAWIVTVFWWRRVRSRKR